VRLGEPVSGYMMQEWRFVEDDMHHIAERVTQFDPDARLALRCDTGQYGIVRQVQLPVLGQTWIVGMMLRDPEGKPLTREPDGRVMHQLREYDTWRHSHPGRTLREQARKLLELRERAQQQLIRERAGEFAEAYLFQGRKYHGIARNIYVPADIPRGQG
jgi:hypothetical protein